VLAGGLAGGLTTLVIVLPSVAIVMRETAPLPPLPPLPARAGVAARARAATTATIIAMRSHIVFSLLTTDETSSARRGNPTPQMGLTALAKPRLSLDRGML
jgi:hypothetical protein